MIHTGDCIEVMAGMPADSVDAVCTDPPYALEFMGRKWDTFGRGEARSHATATFTEDGMGKGFKALPSYLGGLNSRCKTCGKSQRGGSPCQCEKPDFTNEILPRVAAFQAWCEAWGREALRVTKPGGYLLAFGGTRTHHRLVCGLEDAGWIIRDELTWVYASGFPKGKANLKPAHEPIVLARKPGPLRALNIDATRIPLEAPTRPLIKREPKNGADAGQFPTQGGFEVGETAQGRWPSNLLLSDPELFDVANPGVVGSGATQAGSFYSGPRKTDTAKWTGVYSDDGGTATGQPGYGDSGGYSRFFKIPHRHDWWCEDDSGRCEEDAAGDDEGDFDAEPEPDGIDPEHSKAFIIPKADRADREPVLRPEGHERGKRFSDHPTVKPTDLMRHLVRLVTPPGGTVLDCFLGSGSTAIACELEGFPWIGIEQDPGYVKIAEARLNGVQRGLGLAI